MPADAPAALRQLPFEPEQDRQLGGLKPHVSGYQFGTMRTAYYQQLSALWARIGELCGLAADAMEHATSALLHADLTLAEQVIADHRRIAGKSRTAEAALRLLALQQPVAGDLRKIVCSLHIGADTERMGAFAVHVVIIARRRHPPARCPMKSAVSFTEMAEVAVQLERTAQEVLRWKPQHREGGAPAPTRTMPWTPSTAACSRC